MPTSSSSSSGMPPDNGGNNSGRSRRTPLPNQAILDELSKAETICLLAQRPAYSGPLAAREITAERVTAALLQIPLARAKSHAGTQATVSKEGITGVEEDKKTKLMAKLDEMQTAAKQKFGRTDRNRLQNYAIGNRIDTNRPLLEQMGQQIIDQAAADALPGITSTKIQAARDALKAYKDIDLDQSGAQAGATGARGTLKTMMKAITDFRIEVQLAADAEWPHSNPDNASIRTEFKLPAKAKFKG